MRKALFFNGQIFGSDSHSLEIRSDTSFTCERVTSLAFINCPGMMRSLAPFEYQMGETLSEPMQITVSANKAIEIEACLPDGTIVNQRTKALTV